MPGERHTRFTAWSVYTTNRESETVGWKPYQWFSRAGCGKEGLILKGHVGILGVMEMFFLCVCVYAYIYIYLFLFIFIFCCCCTAHHVRSWFPDQESNLCPLHWKGRVLTTVPPEKPLKLFCLLFIVSVPQLYPFLKNSLKREFYIL